MPNLKKSIIQKSNNKYYIFNKPFNVLSQFTAEDNKACLSDFIQLPKTIYPVGRLDFDSEGLLILTNDNFLKSNLLDPKNNHSKTYFAQVEGIPNSQQLESLENGVYISVNNSQYLTLPAKARVIINEPNLPEREIPIRFRKNIPTSWIEIKITEGKNRQVRKMTAKVGLPTLRLIRIAIEDLFVDNLLPGNLIEISKNSIYKKLNIIQ